MVSQSDTAVLANLLLLYLPKPLFLQVLPHLELLSGISSFTTDYPIGLVKILRMRRFGQ
jgi:hypothetical protein